MKNIIYNFTITAFSVLVLFSTGCRQRHNNRQPFNKLTIVKNGYANAIIAIPEDATPVVSFSAKELNSYIKEITGISLPIKQENTITNSHINIISVGPTKISDHLGLSTNKMIFGEFICRQKSNIISILGRDNNIFNPKYGIGENGTWNGMCRFAEKYLGIRWLWPGDYGLVVPETKNLTINLHNDFSEKPRIAGRRVRDKIYLQEWKNDWAKIGINEKKWQQIADCTYRWQKFMLKGGSINDVPGGHGFTEWWHKYHKKHPDWFALQPDGTRTPPLNSNFCAPSTVKLCVSNPEVAKQVVENAVEHYKKSDEIFRAGINDNANAAICVCEKCRALDCPEQASPYTYRYASGSVNYCYVTDRYVDFWNRIGKQFREKCPGKLISVTAYGCITEPPIKQSIKYKNILLAYMGFEYLNEKMLLCDRKWWKEWSKKTVGKLSLRTNNLICGYGLSYFYGRELAYDFNHLFAEKLYSIENEALFCYFATNGLNYYILYKLMWNPELDVEGLIDDYCRKGFGKAAPEIKKYYNQLEILTKKVASHNWGWRKPLLTGLPSIYTTKEINKLQNILNEAKSKVSGDELMRVEFLQEGLQYTKIITDILRAKNANSDEQLQQAYAARKAFFQKQKFPLSIPYPADMTWRRYNPNEL